VKVLITGADGQVGRAMAANAPADAKVVALPRTRFDLSAGAAMEHTMAQLAPNWVVNCAAYTAVDQAETDLAQADRINGSAVAELAAACTKVGAKLAHFSTDFVFSGAGSTPYPVDATPCPSSVYGRTKLAGEQAALAVPGNLVIRTAWVYAAQGRNFVHTMLRLMAERDELRVVDDQIGTPTHAASLARTTWALIGSGASGLWHATDAGVASWYDFAQAIQDEAAALGLVERTATILPIPTAAYPTPANRPAYSVLDKRATWDRVGQAPHWRHELAVMLKALHEASHG